MIKILWSGLREPAANDVVLWPYQVEGSASLIACRDSSLIHVIRWNGYTVGVLGHCFLVGSCCYGLCKVNKELILENNRKCLLAGDFLLSIVAFVFQEFELYLLWVCNLPCFILCSKTFCGLGIFLSNKRKANLGKLMMGNKTAVIMILLHCLPIHM